MPTNYADKFVIDQEIVYMKDSALTNKVNSAKNTYQQTFNGRRFVIFGDSYAGGYDSDDGYSTLANGWAKQLQSIIGLSDSDFIIFHDGGSGFASAGPNGNWAEQVSHYSSSITNPETITDIIFGGGYNDNAASVSAISGGISSAVSAAKTLCPNARIYIAFMANHCYDLTIHQHLFGNVREAYKYGSTANQYTYIQSAETAILKDGDFSSDGIHPKASGNLLIAQMMHKGLMDNLKYFRGFSAIITRGSKVSQLNTGTECKINDDKLTITFNPQTIKFSGIGAQGLNNYAVELLSHDLPMLRPANSYQQASASIPCVMKYTESGTTKYKNTIVRFRLTNKAIEVVFLETNDAHSNYLTAEPTEIQMPYLSFTFDIFQGTLI